jgi:hypothetical protein
MQPDQIETLRRTFSPSPNCLDACARNHHGRFAESIGQEGEENARPEAATIRFDPKSLSSVPI